MQTNQVRKTLYRWVCEGVVLAGALVAENLIVLIMSEHCMRERSEKQCKG